METSSFASPGMAGHAGARQGVSAGGDQDIETALLEIFRSDSSEGVDCETAHRLLRANPKFAHMSLAEVKKTVVFMSNQGRLYSTIDDDHYMSTE